MVNSIVFYFFIIFHCYLHAFVNAGSRKRLFQDALFFDGFAFRHRKTTKKLDFSLFFWRSSFTACSLEESRLSNGSDWHRHCFPSAIAIVWRTATTVGSVLHLCGSVASRMSASARDEVGSVASRMNASARDEVGSVASRMNASARDEVGNVLWILFEVKRL